VTMKAAPYRDLNNKSGDLITKNFLTNNAISISAETRSGDVTIKSTVSGDDKKPIAAVLEPKYEWKEHDLGFEAKFSTANAFNAKSTFKNVGTAGLNFSVAGDRIVTEVPDTKEGATENIVTISNYVTGGVQYSHELVNFGVDAKLPIAHPKERPSVSASLHAKPIPNASIGFKTDYEQGGSLVGEGKLVGGTADIEGGLSVTYPAKLVGVSLWHSYNPFFQWSASFAHSLAAPPVGKPPLPTAVNVAGNYKFDEFTIVKARLTAGIDRTTKAEHGYRGAVSLQQKINPSTTVTIGADVNINQAFGIGNGKTGAASSYGVQLAFK